MEAIESYLKTLREMLKRFGVSDSYSYKILESIRMRMTSLIWYWLDETQRKALLFIGKEEGIYYLPKASNPDIAPFVVVTIRNSLLETAASVDFKNAGLRKALSSEQIKEITSAAIKYFSTVDFEKLSEQMAEPADDFYGKIVYKYPTAFLAFTAISTYDDLRFGYKVQSPKPYQLPDGIVYDKSKVIPTGPRSVGTELSGIDGRIDTGLFMQLQRIAGGKIDIFYADSLKSISRNFEKLLTVFEFVLTRGATVATVNYYFENGYVEKRENIIKPLSGTVDVRKNIINLNEVGPGHLSVFKSIKE